MQFLDQCGHGIQTTRLSRFVPGLVIAVLFGWLSAATAQDSSRGNSSARSSISTEMPTAFSQEVPSSLAALQEMQDHLVKLFPHLEECTVGLRIGPVQGSGVIVRPDGYILTAAHVSGVPGRPVTIITSDGRRLRGTTLGRNSVIDASMIRIDSNRTDWPHAKLAVEPVERGDWCAVLGHPGGFQNDRGAVLRLGRVTDKTRWRLQSDCELVGGDSGGPIFNMRGEVIGINTHIGDRTDYNFHVPSDMYRLDWDRLAAGEDFKAHSGAYLGVSGTTNDEGLGMKITRIFEGEPADRAGLKVGDILLTFQGQKISSLQDLIQYVGEEPPGKRVTLGVLRDGETEEIRLRLGIKWD